MTMPSFPRRPLAALGTDRPGRRGRGFQCHATCRGSEPQTIDDVLSKKKIQVGILVDLPPFGVVNAKNEYEGFDVDVAKLMAKYLGVDCELVAVTGPNRIPYLLTGKVDVLVATFGITPERARQVQFCIPYSSIDIVLMAPKSRRSRRGRSGIAARGCGARQHAGHRDRRGRATRHAHHALRRRRHDGAGAAVQPDRRHRRQHDHRAATPGDEPVRRLRIQVRAASPAERHHAAPRPESNCTSGSTRSSTSSRTTASSTRSTASG